MSSLEPEKGVEPYSKEAQERESALTSLLEDISHGALGAWTASTYGGGARILAGEIHCTTASGKSVTLEIFREALREAQRRSLVGYHEAKFGVIPTECEFCTAPHQKSAFAKIGLVP